MAGYATPAWTNNASPAISATNLLNMGQGIEIAEHPYGVCSTASSTAAKTVTVDFSGTLTLFEGLEVRVKFIYANTASNPTLNVNGTGDVPIMLYRTTPADNRAWIGSDVVPFRYDGTNWIMGVANGIIQRNISYYEYGDTASRAYAVGEYVCWRGILCRVTVAIASGGAITIGTNCIATTVGAELCQVLTVDDVTGGKITYTSKEAVMVGRLCCINIRGTVTDDIAGNSEIVRVRNVPPITGQVVSTMYKGFAAVGCRVNSGTVGGYQYARLYTNAGTGNNLTTGDNINFAIAFIV